VGAPLHLLHPFDPEAWDLMTVEARTDSGKSVSTAWRQRAGSTTLCLSFGFNDLAWTLFRASSGRRAAGSSMVRLGPSWDLVDQ
jgi:hypothetical protein